MKQGAQLDVTNNKRLILSIGEFRKDERIDLQQYVKVNGEYISTKKGVNFNAEWLGKFVKLIEKLRDE